MDRKLLKLELLECITRCQIKPSPELRGEKDYSGKKLSDVQQHSQAMATKVFHIMLPLSWPSLRTIYWATNYLLDLDFEFVGFFLLNSAG